MVGNVLFTNKKRDFSAGSARRRRTTYTNWPTVRSAGAKNLCLSRSGMSVLLDLFTIIGTRPGKRCFIRSDSAFLCSRLIRGIHTYSYVRFLSKWLERGGDYSVFLLNP